jgi:hypothetical protein
MCSVGVDTSDPEFMGWIMGSTDRMIASFFESLHRREPASGSVLVRLDE